MTDEYDLRNWHPRVLFKNDPIHSYKREGQGRKTRWDAEAKLDGECWRVAIWRGDGIRAVFSLRSSANSDWEWDGFPTWEDAARFAEEFIRLRRDHHTWESATNEQRRRLSEMEAMAKFSVAGEVIERERQVAEDIKVILRAFAEEMAEEDEDDHNPLYSAGGDRAVETTRSCARRPPF
jgi:hypothetical protein